MSSHKTIFSGGASGFKKSAEQLSPMDPNSDNLAAESEKEGVKEAIKEDLKEEFVNKERFEALVNQAPNVLLRVRNILPIFKDEVVIDVNKVDLIHRFFFFTGRNHSIALKDITDVFTETIPFLATLNVVDQGFAENTVSVRWLKKKDAEKARRIITGLMEAKKEEIDLTRLNQSDLAEKLEELGRIRETEPV